MFSQGANAVQHKVNTYKGNGFFEIDGDVYKYPVKLAWFNCYTWGNGVESDRIRDDFNAPQIDNGVKVSTTFLDYGEEHKGSGMIYSGLYNSTSGVNELNEFNTGEKIQKDLNPAYGSIQRLKQRDTDIVVFAEDKILQVVANKDAVYNADGDPRLIATNRVLGQAGAFAGNYGISKNPESLAWDNYRMYFTDKERGTVLRLSQDGLTPISSVGMKSWFRDNLSQSKHLLGTFDTVNGDYNLTLTEINKTVSFNEESKGWVSFKSFIPQAGESVTGNYITAKDAGAWKHYAGNRNNFYDEFSGSQVTFYFNEMPGTNKRFQAINFEGTKARIENFNAATADAIDINGDPYTMSITGDGEYYNSSSNSGWSVQQINTNLEAGKARYFKEKEGKFHSMITGGTSGGNQNPLASTADFSVQGIGIVSDVSLLPQYDLPSSISNEIVITTCPENEASSSSTSTTINIDIDGEDNDND